MNVKRLDANLLIALDAVLTERNLTRAGVKLGITQPAMSNALARLRRQLGDPLLVRVGRRFELTVRATELAPVVREAISASARTLQVHPAFDPATSRRMFLIAASDYALSVLTAPLMAATGSAAPFVTLNFVPLPTSSVDATDLLRRDVILASSGRGVPGNQLEVFADRFVVVADAHNSALQRGRLEMEDLARSAFVVGTFGTGNRTPVDDALRERGIAPRIAVSCRGFLSIPFFVAGTDRVGIVPERVARRTCSSLGLVVVETPLQPVPLIEVAHWHPNSAADPGLRWLLTKLKAIDLR